MKRSTLILLFLAGTAPVIATFQNCSGVDFASTDTAATAVAAGDAGAGGGAGGGTPTPDTATTPPVIVPPGGSTPVAGGTPSPNSEDVIDTLKTIKPAFAVRGMNCIACHGDISANVVTDFGYGSRNFIPNGQLMQRSGDDAPSRTAFNNINDGGGTGGWDLLKVSGTVYVPRATLSTADAKAGFGVNNSTSLIDLVMPWMKKVTPASGAKAVAASKIKITYPTADEISALLPSATARFGLVNLKKLPQGSLSGLALDSSTKFVRNSGAVVCKGDVIVRGTLFLKDLNLETDAGGCRLYVSGSVFIQGPIQYLGANAAKANLQITSARLISMGLSAQRMGAWNGAPPSNARSQVRVNSGGQAGISSGAPGNKWERFSSQFDEHYSPGESMINGVARAAFFDDIVSEAKNIGSELLDAGDTAAVSAIQAPAYRSSDNRVAINFSRLLLNAPQVHSRYGGEFSGVIIADVAMLARNDSNSQIEKFVYDAIFDTAPFVLPALTTKVLDFEL